MLQLAFRTKRPGAASVEFALVAPVILATFLGIVELGRGLMVVHLLNNAAAAGCRVGIIEGKSTDNITTAVGNVLTPLGITADTTTVTVNDGSANASTAVAGQEITVRVSVPVTAVSWVPFLSYFSGSLQGQYTLRRE
jgi:Flp pilus assembly protein TadG